MKKRKRRRRPEEKKLARKKLVQLQVVHSYFKIEKQLKAERESRQREQLRYSIMKIIFTETED